MNTNCLVCGTTWEDFIFGKRRWIEDKAPNRTLYGAQSEFAWNGRNDLGADRAAQPGFVQASITPTWEFIVSELKHGEDIELLFQAEAAGGVNHYVTLTELRWVDQDMDGIIDAAENATIGYIDPAGGVFRSRAIAQGGAGQKLQVDYNNNGVLDSRIAVVVTESPVSLPPTIVLLGMGLIALVGSTRYGTRRSSRPSALSVSR